MNTLITGHNPCNKLIQVSAKCFNGVLILSTIVFGHLALAVEKLDEKVEIPANTNVDIEIARTEFGITTRPAGDYGGYIALRERSGEKNSGADQVLFFIDGATSFDSSVNSSQCKVNQEVGFSHTNWSAQCSTTIANAGSTNLKFNIRQVERGFGASQKSNSELVSGYWYSATIEAETGPVSLGKLFVPDSLQYEQSSQTEQAVASGQDSEKDHYEVLGLSSSSSAATALGSLSELSGILASTRGSNDATSFEYTERAISNIDNLKARSNGIAVASNQAVSSRAFANAKLPLRAYDSRNDPRGKVRANTTRNVSLRACKPDFSFNQVTNRITRSPLVINVTAVTPSGAGFLTVYRGGDGDRINSRPRVASLAYGRTPVVGANITAWPKNGSLKIYSSNTTHVIIDCFLKPLYSGGTMSKVILKEQKRIYDTRSPRIRSLKAGQARLVKVVGTKAAGGITNEFTNFPVDYAMVNLTTVRAKGSGFIKAYKPSREGPPATSNLNFSAGPPQANRAIVPVSASGHIAILSSIETDIIVDVIGWVTEKPGSLRLFRSGNYIADLYQLYPPMKRSFDSRTDGNKQRIPGGRPYTVDANSYPREFNRSPRSAEVTITVAGASNPGYLTVSATGARRPRTSVLSFVPGAAASNTLDVPLDSSGNFDIHLSTPAHVIVDVISRSSR